jgi:GT2 family glycosyltransferase
MEKTCRVTESQPSVVTIVLTWNSEDFVEECLGSLQASRYPTGVLVVDNDSSDGTRDLVGTRFSDVRLVNSGANLGYAGGNNLGMRLVLKEAAPDYVFVLNPDASVSPDCIGTMVERMERDQTLAIASPVIYYHGTDRIWYAGSRVNWWTGATPQIGSNTSGVTHSFAPYTDRANGCALMARTSAVGRVGLMEERYFLYYEEADWSTRFIRAGYRVGLVADAAVWHQNSASTGGGTNPLYQYYMTRNRLLFMSKFQPSRRLSTYVFSICNSCRNLGIIWRKTSTSRARLCGDAILKGYVDFRHGAFGHQPHNRRQT